VQNPAIPTRERDNDERNMTLSRGHADYEVPVTITSKVAHADSKATVAAFRPICVSFDSVIIGHTRQSIRRESDQKSLRQGRGNHRLARISLISMSDATQTHQNDQN
jgi:hypothetical protein